jgi:hypothetical protein
MEETRKAYKIFVSKPERKRSIGRPRLTQGNNITIDLKGIGYDDVDWIHLAQDIDQWRILVNMVMSLWVP